MKLCSGLNVPFTKMDRQVNDNEVGVYTYGQNYITIKDFECGGKLKIGKFCSISSNITIFLGGNHIIKNVSTYPFWAINKDIFKYDIIPELNNKNNVIIGNDVWIGHGVTIMSGVSIGDGSVISANSTVFKNVKPYSVVGGNPSEFLYFRFRKEIIKELLEIKWWDFEIEKINELLPYICNDDIENFLKKAKNV